jgi:DNA gyrase subunit A
MTLGSGDWLIDALLIHPEQDNPMGDLITVTERGYVKRTSFDEYKPQGRAGRGITIAKIDAQKTGYIISTLQVTKEDKLLNIIQQSGAVTTLEVKSLMNESRVKSGIDLVGVMLNDYVIQVI